MKIAVIGAGYVGLVAGACFSDTGNDVTVTDADADRIRMLRSGRMPIYEPGLGEIATKNVQEERLSFTTEVPQAVGGAEVVILAVGTPSAPDGSVAMRWMDAAARQVAEAMTGYTVIVTKSTVPVGTHRRVSDIVRSATDAEFDYVANPEFLKEGSAVDDFIKPDRVILGLDSERALSTMQHLYAPFSRRRDKLLVMDPASAELTKYACNAMLATRISFVNELTRLCEHFGADISDVRRGMGTDSRIGPDFLYPSLGFGGSCFPKDVKALISMGRAADCPLRVVEAVHLANQEQCRAMFRRIEGHFGGSVKGRRVAVWGLAFKAGTDDVRESPAVALVQRLIGAGASVAAYDPKAADNARAALGTEHVEYCRHMYDPLPGADALVICTEWREFRTPDFQRVAGLMRGQVIFDGRNLYDRDWMAQTPFEYYSLGRPPVCASKGAR
jgi:UDPglucose 6-dehydrogenase